MAFANSFTTLYDNYTSAMSFTLADGGVMVKLSPVNSALRGKQAAKGEKMYDYDNGVNFLITPSTAYNMVYALQELITSSNVKTVSVLQGTESNGTQITFYKPEGIKLLKRTFDKYCVKFVKIKDGATVSKLYHFFDTSTYLADTEDGEADVHVETSLNIFMEIMKQLYSNVLPFGIHANKFTQGADQRKSSNYIMDEDDDIDEDDDETPKSKKESAKAAAKKAFEDDDDEY